MAISYVGTAELTGNSNITSATVPLPSGTAAGDFLLLSLVVNANQTTATPTGWSVWVVTPGTTISYAVFYRFADSGDVAAGSVTLSGLATNRYQFLLESYRGVDTTTPKDVAVGTATGTTSLVAFPSITPVTTGAYIVAQRFAQHASGVAVTSLAYSSTNMTVRDYANSNNTSTANQSLGAADVAWTSGAFTANLTVNVAVAQNRAAVGALRPASAVATTHSIDGTTSATATVTGSSSVTRPASGDLSATASLSGTTSATRPGSGTTTATASITGAASVVTAAKNLDGTLSATTSPTGAAAVTRPASGTLSVSAAISGAASVVKAIAGSLSATASIVGAALTGKPLPGATTTATATITGSASVTRGISGNLSVTATAAGGASVGQLRDITFILSPPGFDWAATLRVFEWDAEVQAFQWEATLLGQVWDAAVADFDWGTGTPDFTWTASVADFIWASGPPDFD